MKATKHMNVSHSMLWDDDDAGDCFRFVI
jgi:hypothetical protein